MENDATLWQQGNAHAARRDWPAAIRSFQSLAERDVGLARPWIALAKAFAAAGEHRRGHDAAMTAFAAGTSDWSTALALARLLRGLHEVRALVALADAMTRWADEAPSADLIELADLLGQVDAHEQAMPWLERVLRRDPESAPARYLRGTTRLFLGELDAAREDLEQAVRIAPHFAHAHWRLSELRDRDVAGAPARVARMTSLRERVEPGSEHDIHFSFALHAELHDLGRHDDAWQALERGCLAKRKALAYDVATDVQLLRRVAREQDAAFIAGAGHEGQGEPVPVFIVGLFRSGTTLLERFLAGHSELADGGETLGFTAALRRAVDHRSGELLDATTLDRTDGLDFQALGADFMARSSWRAQGRAAWTEKLPSNFVNLGLIARALPRARFLHAWRAPRDVAYSNLRTLYGGIARYTYDPADLAAYHAAYRELMAHWRSVLGDRLLDVSHADLVRAPEVQLRRVLAHLGLHWEPGVLDLAAREGAVSTASAAQVRGGLRAPGAPAWQPYEAQLRPLFDALAATPD